MTFKCWQRTDTDFDFRRSSSSQVGSESRVAEEPFYQEYWNHFWWNVSWSPKNAIFLAVNCESHQYFCLFLEINYCTPGQRIKVKRQIQCLQHIQPSCTLNKLWGSSQERQRLKGKGLYMDISFLQIPSHIYHRINWPRLTMFGQVFAAKLTIVFFYLRNQPQ